MESLSNALSDLQARASLGGTAVAVLVILVVAWALAVIVLPRLKKRLGGTQILGILPSTAEQTHASLAAYGPDGRNFFLKILAADLITPIASSFLLIPAMAFAVEQFAVSPPWSRVVTVLPLLAWLFDWGENVTLATLTVRFPRHASLGWLAAGLTTAKLLAFWVGWMVAAIGLLAGWSS